MAPVGVRIREGASPFPEHYDVYKRIAAEVLHSVTPSTAEDVALLRVVMSKVLLHDDRQVHAPVARTLSMPILTCGLFAPRT